MSTLVQIAEAIKDSLNSTFGGQLTAQRLYQAQLDQVTLRAGPLATAAVVPEGSVIERASRAHWTRDQRVQVYLMRPAIPGQQADLDAMEALSEQVADHLQDLGSPGDTGAELLTVEHEPVVELATLREDHVFLSIIAATYRR